MPDRLLYETFDRFAVAYDILVLVHEDVASESAIASAAHVPPSAVASLLSFLLLQGFIKTAGSDREFKITTLGASFLGEFHGMRKFLS